MTEIYLETLIDAPVNICFDLSRSIDLHQLTTVASNEKAIAGRTQGLIEKGESVTWQATHFFIKQKLTVKIIDMLKPYYFNDKMTRGAFKSMQHNHIFRPVDKQTLMIDEFEYTVPFGFIGKVFNRFILQRYMTKLLIHRNNFIKKIAESEEWKKFISL
jgi:ligand-binding SRPBCC domain-containing protein